MYFSQERHARIQDQIFELIRSGSTTMFEDNFEYPLSIYADAEVAELERSKIFRAKPMMAAHSSQIAEVGSYAALNLNSSSVILTRQEDGSVQALLNKCSHRGAQLVEPGSSGVRKAFACPYHGWAYGSDGVNRRISFDDTFGQSPCSDFDLVRLPVEERHGFIWVMEDPNTNINVAEHLGEMDSALAEYNLDSWHFYKEHVFDFPQNWKIMMDGLMDSYHVQFLHGKTIAPYFINNCKAVEHLGDHTLGAMPRKTFMNYLDKDVSGVDLSKDIIISNLFTPNTMMVMHPHHIEYWTIYQHPDGPGRSLTHLRYLSPKKEHDERGHKIMEKNWKIAVDAIINEDVPVGNSVQASASGSTTGKAILGKNEYLNQVFHRTYKKLMEA